MGPRRLLASPNYLRLWLAGGIGNGFRWLEILIVGIYTFDQTGSSFLVAAVLVARTLPMLLLGPIAGVIGEAFDRKRLLAGGLFVMAGCSAALCFLAIEDLLRLWHLALAGSIAGSVWATEMAVRRRMVGEVMPPEYVAQAIAFDSLTASFARMAGPFLGGIVFVAVGLRGAYLAAAVLQLTAALMVLGLDYHQEPRPFRFGRIAADIGEGLAIVRRHRVMLGVVLVTIITNMFGFSYSALLAPLGLHRFGVSPILVGALGAAEPLGAITSGLAFSAGWLRFDRRHALLRGSVVFFAGLVAAGLAPWYGLAFGALLLGGLGTAAFSIMQTTLILTEAPPAARSRIMGLITAGIGTGPLGVLLVGAASESIGPSPALLLTAGLGLAGLGLVRLSLARLPPAAEPTGSARR